MIVVTANVGPLRSEIVKESLYTDKKVCFTRLRRVKIGRECRERSFQLCSLNANDHQ
jgi:hypothetical protein